MADAFIPSHLTVRLISLPTRRTLAAAHDTSPDDSRLLTIVTAHLDGDLGVDRGWGECSALNHRGYTNESAGTAFDLLVEDSPLDRENNPMAAAAVEMALLDVSLRSKRTSLATSLGTEGRSATAGAVVGLGPLPQMLGQIDELVQRGYRRVKCKVLPGHMSTPLRAIRAAYPSLELQIDANGSLSRDDLDELRSLEELDVSAVEQPFAVDDEESASRLVAETDLVVIADESLSQASDVDRLSERRTATAVAVKPPKLGGLDAALGVLAAAEHAGMTASIGGMLESGLGRHQLAALAPHAGFGVVGDLSPARQWLAADPFGDIELRDDGTILAPSQPGIAGDPDTELLDRFTVAKQTVPFNAGKVRPDGPGPFRDR